MIAYWIFVTLGVVGLFLLLGIAVLFFIRQERNYFRNRILLKTCTDLFSAIRAIHQAGNDESILEPARLRLRETAGRLNQLANYELLLRVNDLLDFLDESAGGEPDLSREQQILGAIVTAARHPMDPVTARELEAAASKLLPNVPQKKS